MELWFLFALLGYMIGAVSGVLDKYMMNQQYHPVTTVMLRTLCNALFLGVAGLLFINLRISAFLLLLAAVPAFLLVISFVVYLRVLQQKNASEIQPFSQSLDVLFIFLASIVLLQEEARPENYVGILFLVIGVYLVIAEHITKLPRLDHNFLIIAALVPIDVAYALLIKTYLGSAEPVALAVSIYIMSFLMLLGISLAFKRQLHQTAASLKTQLRIVLVASLCAAAAVSLFYTALSQANASKVYPMAGISSVTVFLLATMFLKEKFHKHRFVGTLIVLVGIYLITL
ncbi:MAG: DMT family transporter [Candidatus Thermoplasmatota archaeon]|nr:DMT family transporter [Candidatus Thermoplasmatota archaeon]